VFDVGIGVHARFAARCQTSATRAMAAAAGLPRWASIVAPPTVKGVRLRVDT
jgi:hypothetical protein